VSSFQKVFHAQTQRSSTKNPPIRQTSAPVADAQLLAVARFVLACPDMLDGTPKQIAAAQIKAEQILCDAGVFQPAPGARQ
jgi:hypothetical protein